MTAPTARERFFTLLRETVGSDALVKLTLGKHRGSDATLENVFIRPVALKSGPRLAFVWRHATRDVTKNVTAEEGLALIDQSIGRDFLDAHLFTKTQQAQLETKADGSARLKVTRVTDSAQKPMAPAAHDREKAHLIRVDAPWLRALGVTNDRGQPREGMADKFRQIQKFAELLQHLIAEAFSEPPGENTAAGTALRIVDMGSGKGYLTFALADLLGAHASILGVEARRELVDLCNRVARENGLAPRLEFTAGSIADAAIETVDVLIALHACDTATDDALARGIAAGARLLVVAPCCQKELRAQITAPGVLAGALRHGIFEERQAEFLTDALRAELLEAAGYRTKVFEFISTEHTAKNLMIAAIKSSQPRESAQIAAAERARSLATFYGVRKQRLAEHLHVPLSSGT